jgi:hypothetical protein
MQSNESPVISVIMLAGPLRPRAVKMLGSVLEQDIINQMELIVLDFEPESVPPLSGHDHPQVTYIRADRKLHFGAARALGVRMSHAPIVASLEEHANACPGWAAALVAAHEGQWAGVGPEFHPRNPHIGISDSVGQFNYSTAIAPAPRGPAPSIPGHNSSFKRDILLKYGAELDDLLLAEIVLQWRLQEDGYQLFIEPNAKFQHANETAVKSIMTGMFIINYCLGATRPRLMHWSRAKFLFYLMIAPFSPWIRTFKLLTNAFGRGRSRLLGFLPTMPMVFFIQSVSVLAHFLGMIFGLRGMGVKFREYEISEPRKELVNALD